MAPAATMGTIYVGDMNIRYDVSGGTVLQLPGVNPRVYLPNMKDATLWLMAEALGYGRQVGQLVRDRILMHCLLAHVEGYEPSYLQQCPSVWPCSQRVDMLLCIHNQVRCHYVPDGADQLVLFMAYNILRGGGIGDQ